VKKSTNICSDIFWIGNFLDCWLKLNVNLYWYLPNIRYTVVGFYIICFKVIAFVFTRHKKVPTYVVIFFEYVTF